MQKLEIKMAFLAYESEREISSDDQHLLAAAKKALGMAYAPYSKFQVGAAAFLTNGKIVTSANYENASYPICVCAEHSALIAAANQYPDSIVTTLAITVKNPASTIERPALPCGSCRQVICETEKRNNHVIKVILQGERGPVFIFEQGTDMLPLAFDASFL